MEPLTYLVFAILVLAVVFVVFRVAVPRGYAKSGKLTPLYTLLEYVAILSWVWFGYVNRPPDWPTVHVGPALQVVGWALFIGGWVFALAGMVGLGLRRTHGLQANALRQTGLYRLTRNPQVVAFLAAIVGYVMLWPTWRNAGVLVLVAVLCHTMIKAEEKHLRDVFGDEYVRYCARVPRYLGPRRASASG
jgi:protein-S-isoprenylcysteine O-methyltransferase Ste14